MMNNNELQLLASDPGYSIYVSASAGSGKTKVLIDRILRLLLNGTHIANILCVTFTKVAANEILDRLKNYTKRWKLFDDVMLQEELAYLTGCEPDHNTLMRAKSLYKEILKEYARIKIQTMHAFCANVLNIQVDKNKDSEQKIISTAEQADFLKQAFDYVVSLQSMVVDVDLLSAIYSEKTIFEYTTDLIMQYAKFSQYIAAFEDENHLCSTIYKTFSVDHKINIEHYIEQKISDLQTDDIKRISVLLENEDICNWLKADKASQIRLLNQYMLIFLTQDHSPRARIKGANKLSAYDLVILQRYQSALFNLAEGIKSYRLAAINLAFTRVTSAVFHEYKRLKQESKLLDYDELLLNTINTLSASDHRDWLLWRLDCEIDHILVDEAQDLNSYQWHIIKLLADEFFAGEGAKDINRTIFIVGDIKQSIFSFQGAEPIIFQNIKDYYRQKAHDAQKQWLEINLNISYRSGNEILNMVDNIFADDVEALGGGPYLQHISYRGTKAHVEAWDLIRVDKEVNDIKGWRMPKPMADMSNKYSKLADLITNHISHWLQHKRIVTGTDKIIEPQDIMVILRKRGPIYSNLVSRLRSANIPVISGSGAYLLDSLIIWDILAVAKFVLNPLDDYNLVNLLKSYFFNFSENEIFELVKSSDKKGIWHNICTDSIFKIHKEILNDIHIAYIQRHLYDFFYYLTFKYLRPNLPKNNNEFNIIINTFLEAVLEFKSNTKLVSLRDFVRWLNLSKIQINSSQISENAIKITTAHSSKGLQASVVILADASESDNLATDGFFWWNDKLIFNSSEANSTVLMQAIKADLKLEQSKESKRLMYVAFTRAENELYLSGIASDRNNGKNWYSYV